MASLVTIEDYESAIGTELDPVMVVRVDEALEAASDAVRRHCAQTFDLVTDDEIELDGTGTAELILPECPVVAVTAVTITIPSGTETPTYSLGRQGGILRRTGWRIWPLGYGNVAVTYTHGYAVIPADLKKVVSALAEKMVLSIGRDSALQSKTVGPFSETYFQNAMTGIDLGAYDNMLEPFILKQIPVP